VSGSSGSGDPMLWELRGDRVKIKSHGQIICACFDLTYRTNYKKHTAAEIACVIPYKPHTAKNYIVATDTMSLASVNLRQLALTDVIVCEIMCNDSHSTSPILVSIKSLHVTSNE